VVEKAAYDFIHEIINCVKKLQQGNPFDNNITTGPMARIDLAQTLHKQMLQSVEKRRCACIGR